MPILMPTESRFPSARNSYSHPNGMSIHIHRNTHEFLAAWNEKPRPFVWTATVESIVAKLGRCRQTLEQIQPGCTAPKSRKRKSS